MLLKLNNVKNHSQLEIEIPDAGLVKIDGSSGCGKSSIMEAIYDALNGDSDDIVSWGTTSSMIGLEWLDHTIGRQRGPARLTLDGPGIGQQVDEAAQESIRTSLLGMNQAEFDAAAYIRQRMEGSLLALGPAEQLKLIQRLSQGSTDPEQVRVKIQKKISELNGQRKTYEAQAAQLETDISIAEANLLAAVLPPAPDIEVVDPAALQAERREHDDHVRLLLGSSKEHVKKIESLNRKISDQEMAETSASADIERATKHLADLETQSAPLPFRIAEYVAALETMPKREAVEAAVKRTTTLDRLKTITAELDAIYPGRPKDVRPSGWAQEQLTQSYEQSKRYAELIPAGAQRLAELKAMKRPQQCPDCGAPLAVQGGLIQKAQALPEGYDKQVYELEGEQSRQRIHADAIKTVSTKVEVLLARASQLMADLPPAGESIPDPAAALKARAEAETALTKARTNLEALTAASEKAKIALDYATQKLKDAKSANKVAELRGEVVLSEALFEANEKELQVVAGKLKELTDRYDKHLRASELVRTYRVAVERQLAKQEAVASAKTARNNHTTAVSINIDRLAAAQRLLEVNDRAATDSIDATVERINSGAQQLLDQFFPEEGTVIRLLNGIQTKAGDRRDKMGVEVWHRGKRAKRVSSLSGGERSRACLAFQLSLAEIYRSPILMIDEGFTGLDSSTKDACIELLRPFAKDRLILVIEHGASDHLFDHVVRIGNVGGNVSAGDGSAAAE